MNTENGKIQETTKVIRENVCESNNVFSTCPPLYEEVSSKSIYIPEKFETFLKALLFTDSKETNNRVLKSNAQDVLYVSTNGRQKTVKHTQTGMIINRKTGSKEVSIYLNRLGLCLSYEELLQLEAFIAKNESKNADISSHVPKDVKQSSFCTLV